MFGTSNMITTLAVFSGSKKQIADYILRAHQVNNIFHQYEPKKEPSNFDALLPHLVKSLVDLEQAERELLRALDKSGMSKDGFIDFLQSLSTGK